MDAGSICVYEMLGVMPLLTKKLAGCMVSVSDFKDGLK